MLKGLARAANGRKHSTELSMHLRQIFESPTSDPIFGPEQGKFNWQKLNVDIPDIIRFKEV